MSQCNATSHDVFHHYYIYCESCVFISSFSQVCVCEIFLFINVFGSSWVNEFCPTPIVHRAARAEWFRFMSLLCSCSRTPCGLGLASSAPADLWSVTTLVCQVNAGAAGLKQVCAHRGIPAGTDTERNQKEHFRPHQILHCPSGPRPSGPRPSMTHAWFGSSSL